MIIDVHSHLFLAEKIDYDSFFQKNKDHIVIISGYNEESNNEVIKLVKKHKNLFGTIGYHPSEKDFNIEILKKQLREDKIIGLGEIGLDFHWEKENQIEQIEKFKKQLDLACEINCPIVVHSRDAMKETIDILEKYPSLKGIIHCFSGSLSDAEKLINMNFKLGIGGVLIFKNSNLKNIVKKIDLKNIVTETDAPYLSPIRGEKNKLENIRIVVEEIANIKKTTFSLVSKTILENVIDIFGDFIKMNEVKK